MRRIKLWLKALIFYPAMLLIWAAVKLNDALDFGDDNENL